jgi:hypothetical protein
MDLNNIRDFSINVTAEAGVSISPAVPLLDVGVQLRNKDDIANRLFCLNAVAAVSYGFDRSQAIEWLRQEQLDSLLTKSEFRFLNHGDGDVTSYQTQVEGMWALAWALCLVPELDFWKDCDDRFVALLPNLKKHERCIEWRRRSQLRSTEDIVAALDLSYCLHWAVREAELSGKYPPAGIKAYVVVERRRALEWLLGDEPWDSVSLDT